MKRSEINYYTEGDKIYIEQIDSCKSKEELEKVLLSWEWLLPDAWGAFRDSHFKWAEWNHWQKTKKNKKKPTKAEETIYMVISMPANMMLISMVAEKFLAPWGTAFIRLAEFNKLEGIK